jgi:hypothetical protein
MAAAVAEAEQPAVGFRRPDGPAEIWELPGGGNEGSESEPAVILLHRLLLPALGFGDESATDGTLVYRSDPQQLWDQVRIGELAAGFWLPPMKPSAFSAAVSAGELMPPKSTRFTPKLASGLVWAPHDAEIV